MKDSLLTDKTKKEILKCIKTNEFEQIVTIMERIKTQHAETPKTKDKRFVIKEIVNFVLDSSKKPEKDFCNIGMIFCNRNEPVSKEIGVSLIWRSYKYDTEKVKQQLLLIADDSNWEVREYAGTAFANTLFQNPDFYDTLLEWAKHDSENVRRAVVFSALALREQELLPKAYVLLGILMFDSSKYVKKNLGPFILGSYFGNKFPKETIKQLKKWSRIRDENVRWNIIMAFNNSFGNKYPEDALEVIKKFVGDADLGVKRAILSTLRFLSKNHSILAEKFITEHKLIEQVD